MNIFSSSKVIANKVLLLSYRNRYILGGRHCEFLKAPSEKANLFKEIVIVQESI